MIARDRRYPRKKIERNKTEVTRVRRKWNSKEGWWFAWKFRFIAASTINRNESSWGGGNAVEMHRREVHDSARARHGVEKEKKKMIMIKEGVGMTSVYISHRPRCAQITDGCSGWRNSLQERYNGISHQDRRMASWVAPRPFSDWISQWRSYENYSYTPRGAVGL